jgi:uroporphyrinogen decarboxylase
LETYINAIGVDADIIQFSDDFGSQEGMLISPQLYRDVFKPRERKMWNFVKKNSKYAIFLHSCGSVYRIIPDLIEAGLDIINPVQISARDMEPERLKQEFGNDLVFWGGGCDTQSVLPRGSLKDIEEEVKKNISIFAQGGGFVFAPVHNIQADITAERITKLYESARIHGGYAMK